MKKLFMMAGLVSGLVSSFGLLSTTANAQQTGYATGSLSANELSVSTPAYSGGSVQTKSSPIFYGSDGPYPFSKAVRVGNTLYMSGELGMKNGNLVAGGVRAQTMQALDNINQTLLSYGYQSSDLVKCMVMLDDMDDFNEFNEGYKAKLNKPYPARSAFAADGLALDAKVEIECIAAK